MGGGDCVWPTSQTEFFEMCELRVFAINNMMLLMLFRNLHLCICSFIFISRPFLSLLIVIAMFFDSFTPASSGWMSGGCMCHNE